MLVFLLPYRIYGEIKLCNMRHLDFVHPTKMARLGTPIAGTKLLTVSGLLYAVPHTIIGLQWLFWKTYCTEVLYNLPWPCLWSELCSSTVDDGPSWLSWVTLGGASLPSCDVSRARSLFLCWHWDVSIIGHKNASALLVVTDWWLHNTHKHRNIL